MILKTTYQRKSAFITFLLMSIVLLLMFFCGLRYMDPPEEYGVAINFGTSDVGSGKPKINESIKSDIVENSSEKTEEVVQKNTETIQDKVLNQDVEEAPVLAKKNEAKSTKSEIPQKKKIKEKKVIEKKPTPTKATQNALSNLFGKKSEGEQATSEGDDDTAGVKGNKEGDPESEKYYGNNGLGGQGNYLLKGRRTLSKPKRKPNCNEEGVVVVKIEVDNTGKVIKAIPGVKGTTNHSPCLLEPAKKAALSTKWNADGNAPVKQIGLIRYKFILSE